MTQSDTPFISGYKDSVELPLGRFLPTLAAGGVASWLDDNTTPGSWVLDPMGVTPWLALEAASAGYRVLVCCNNPIIKFMLDILASAPQKKDFQGVTSTLLNSRRGEERLQTFLKNLYSTECVGCGQVISADSYIWKRDMNIPSIRIYCCPHCGDEGEHPLTRRDEEVLDLEKNDALHRSRALQRGAPNTEDGRQGVQEALNSYKPRSLHFIFTLLNRIDLLGLSEDKRRLLQAVLLSVYDEASTLWPWPGGRSRPRQLITPPQFQEKNLFEILDEAPSAWCIFPTPLPLTHWPELPPGSGGICIYSGRARSLLPILAEGGDQSPHISAVTAVFPRPNQAFWTLSALWAGWLWGKDAAQPLRGALERRRYDWQWYASAVGSVLRSLNQFGEKRQKVFGILPELAEGHNYFMGLTAAAGAVGLKLRGMALSDDRKEAQFLWETSSYIDKSPKNPARQVCRKAVTRFLDVRGEPVSYLEIQAACLQALADQGQFVTPDGMQFSVHAAQMQSVVSEVFNDTRLLRSFSGRGQSLESSQWWLSGDMLTHQAAPTLTDQTEWAIVQYLNEHHVVKRPELEADLCRYFVGLHTPSFNFIAACLQSYAEIIESGGETWQIRPGELFSERQSDLLAAWRMLTDIGTHLGFRGADNEPGGVEADVFEAGCLRLPLLWADDQGDDKYVFHLLATSNVSRYLSEIKNDVPSAKRILVLPGSRAHLLTMKTDRNPILQNSLQSGWQVLKFRHLRRIHSREQLTLALWESLLESDPIGWEDATQMSMFGD
jgi:hypothetical protein